jgi:hypothetical protein
MCGLRREFLNRKRRWRTAEICRLWLRRECISRHLQQFEAHRTRRYRARVTRETAKRGLPPPAISYVVHKLEIELAKTLSRMDDDFENMRRKKARLETELQNLTAAIADGLDSPALRAGIVAREKEIAELTAKVLGNKKNSVHAQVRNLRKFVESSLADVRKLLATNGNPPLVRMALAKHIDAITIGPGESGEIEYKGAFKLLGDDCVSWDGAEGQNRTGYAGLFRAALYR